MARELSKEEMQQIKMATEHLGHTTPSDEELRQEGANLGINIKI